MRHFSLTIELTRRLLRDFGVERRLALWGNGSVIVNGREVRRHEVPTGDGIAHHRICAGCRLWSMGPRACAPHTAITHLERLEQGSHDEIRQRLLMRSVECPQIMSTDLDGSSCKMLGGSLSSTRSTSGYPLLVLMTPGSTGSRPWVIGVTRTTVTCRSSSRTMRTVWPMPRHRQALWSC